jgi:hypothetical protein
MTTDDQATREIVAMADELIEELRAGGIASLGAFRLAVKLRRELREEFGLRHAGE